MTPSSSFRLHRSRMREASEITSRDASEQILALIRVGYTVLTYPRVFPARFHLPYLIRDYHCRRYFNPRPPSLTRISTPLLSAPCIFGSAENSTFPSVQVDFCESRFIAPIISIARNSCSIKDPIFPHQIFVRSNICNLSREWNLNSFYKKRTPLSEKRVAFHKLGKIQCVSRVARFTGYFRKLNALKNHRNDRRI